MENEKVWYNQETDKIYEQTYIMRGFSRRMCLMYDGYAGQALWVYKDLLESDCSTWVYIGEL